MLIGATLLCGGCNRSPHYKAQNHDPVLGKDAADKKPFLEDVKPLIEAARPLIEALEKYHAENGNYPQHAKDCAPFFAVPPVFTTQDLFNDWAYTQRPAGKGYSLWFRLGGDPALIYDFDGAHGRWIYDPGDGTPTKVLLLK